MQTKQILVWLLLELSQLNCPCWLLFSCRLWSTWFDMGSHAMLIKHGILTQVVSVSTPYNIHLVSMLNITIGLGLDIKGMRIVHTHKMLIIISRLKSGYDWFWPGQVDSWVSGISKGESWIASGLLCQWPSGTWFLLSFTMYMAYPEPSVPIHNTCYRVDPSLVRDENVEYQSCSISSGLPHTEF